MLEDLTIKDFAIIDCVTIDFNKGFTVLSGETGAGKSILIGAVSFLLGGKAEVSQIRAGCHEASVTGTFYFSPDTDMSEAALWLNEHGIELEENRIILRRFIKDTGKSSAWIGNVPVTRADLAEFSSFLIDIHGQHEHQSLMKVPEHRKFLDARAGLVEEVKYFTAVYSELVEKRRLLQKMNSSDSERLRKIDMYEFAVKEIEEAKLKPDEDIALEDEENRLSSYEKLFSGIEAIKSTLDGADSSVVPLLKKIRRESQLVSSLDKSLVSLDGRIESSFYELSDICEEYENYARKLVFDPVHLQEVQDRISLIYNLKKKYASSSSASLKEVFDYYENAKSELEKLGAGAESREELEKNVSELEKNVYVLAKSISDKRKTAAANMSSEVESLLKQLGMNGTRFSVGINEKPGNDVEQRCGPYGMDNIEFLISANPGSPMLPLAKIASGGELSRVMLALKTIFAQNDAVQTLVFDEIDTGIGGEIAVAVGKHMQNLAKNRQILCITHLASIAVYADNQIKIEKSVSENVTTSDVHVIEGEERVAEIARMLAGDSNDAQSLEHARSMLNNIRE